jgi:hypothetical protein
VEKVSQVEDALKQCKDDGVQTLAPRATIPIHEDIQVLNKRNDENILVSIQSN